MSINCKNTQHNLTKLSLSSFISLILTRGWEGVHLLVGDGHDGVVEFLQEVRDGLVGEEEGNPGEQQVDEDEHNHEEVLQTALTEPYGRTALADLLLLLLLLLLCRGRKCSFSGEPWLLYLGPLTPTPSLLFWRRVYTVDRKLLFLWKREMLHDVFALLSSAFGVCRVTRSQQTKCGTRSMSQHPPVENVLAVIICGTDGPVESPGLICSPSPPLPTGTCLPSLCCMCIFFFS